MISFNGKIAKAVAGAASTSMLLTFSRAKAAGFHLSAVVRLIKPPRLHLSTASPSPVHNPSKPLTKPDLKALVLSHCSHGKFHGLLQNVVASPAVLLAACNRLRPNAVSSSSAAAAEPLNLETVSAEFFSVEELAAQLAGNRLDVDSCCRAIPPMSRRGKPLVLPNLKLKVVMEAIRMVLEIVYDDRFVTFSYGGRANLGRHTAIRYLKNSVENPSWWFTVSFNPKKFGTNHVDKLCLFIEEKIKDKGLIDLVKRLCECEAINIELGGCYLGRGFPQECRLSPMLINIYFNSFDHEIQEIRVKTSRENRIGVVVSSSSDRAFYKPPKIYAVRYLDEILVITSGTKLMSMELKSRIVKMLEKDLALSVSKERTVIHSAVSEKIEFLGMELQAVAPSVLHPPMSEKAIRARKKYLRQKEVRLLELKNARESNRKKLGMKLLNHSFKKLKRSDGFRFDFRIESEVREIFKTWSEDVVKQFLESVDERWEWHRQLSAGDFLLLERIREQLPRELIDAYDDFRDQVDKYLNPVKAIKAIEEHERSLEEEEERKYSERTVEDLTQLCIKVEAPIETVRKAIKLAGFTNHMGRPRPISLLVALEDVDIIKWYAGIGRRWLEFFCCCHNFKKVKTVVTYHLRFSCILTLAEKHESTKREAIRHFTKDLKVFNTDNGTEEVHFPTERDVKTMGENILSDPIPIDGALTMVCIRLASDEPSYRCAAHFCTRNDTIVYRIRLLQKILNPDPSNEKWVPGMGSIHDSLNRKCLPLCPVHISELYMGRLNLQDVDCSTILSFD